jgi:hypothetical protein
VLTLLVSAIYIMIVDRRMEAMCNDCRRR